MQLKQDMASHQFSDKVMKSLIQDDQLLIHNDKMIWIMEIGHIDSDSDLVKIIKTERQDIGTASSEFRNKIMNIQNKQN